MRKLLLLLSFISLSQAATAADRSWTGFYFGGHGAYFSSDTAYANPTTPTQSLEGALLGLQAGYNWQIGSIVLGAEADVSFGNLTDRVRDGNFLSFNGKINTMGTVRGRLGYSFGNVMPYLTAGYVWVELEQGSSCADGAAIVAPGSACAITGPYNTIASKETLTGFVWGGGVEWAIARQWSLKAELLFMDLDAETYTGTFPVVGTVSAPAGLNVDYLAKVGVNYRF